MNTTTMMLIVDMLIILIIVYAIHRTPKLKTRKSWLDDYMESSIKLYEALGYTISIRENKEMGLKQMTVSKDMHMCIKYFNSFDIVSTPMLLALCVEEINEKIEEFNKNHQIAGPK